MEFILTHPDIGIKEILVIFEGVPYEANSDHPWWDEIIRLCLADDPRVLDLFPIRPVQTASKEIPVEEADAPVETEPRWPPTERYDAIRSWGHVAEQMQDEIDYLTSGLRTYAEHAYAEVMQGLQRFYHD